MWPTERASRQGLIDFLVAAILFLPAVLLLREAGLRYLDQAASLPPFWTGGALLIPVGVAVFRTARRREYPWLLALAAVALLVQAMAADVLPPLRATWVASGLLAGWVVAWLVTSVRYQR